MKKGIIIIISFFGLIFSSCNDLDLAPIDRYTDNNWWESPDRAASVLYQLYADMGGAGMIFDNERLTDNVYSKDGNQHTFLTGQAQSSSGLFSGEWSSCYSGIGKVHIFLENIDRSGCKSSLDCRSPFYSRFSLFSPYDVVWRRSSF